MNLYECHDYKCVDLPFITSSYIREYDIAKANINILYKYGVLNKEQYDYYYQCSRDEREISIGKLQASDSRVTRILQQGIIEAKKMFFEANDIKDEEVLSIRNDAIFLINKAAQITVFDNINFKLKNTYTSFYRLGTCEFYYNYNEITNLELLDIKGIKGQYKLDMHKDYFLDFLLTAFQCIQVATIQETMELMNRFYEQYLELKLDKGYYREFNSDCMYRTKRISSLCEYQIENISQDNLNSINIMCNLNMIRQLMGYYSTICVDMVRRRGSF